MLKTIVFVLLIFEINKFKIYKIVNFLAGDKFAPELHLLQPRFTYSACRPFTNVCEMI